MNVRQTATLIVWESRNDKCKRQAVELCRNYGLRLLTTSAYIGSLYTKERNALHASLLKLFARQTDKLHFLPLCKSCFELSTVSPNVRKEITDPQTFEIVRDVDNS